MNIDQKNIKKLFESFLGKAEKLVNDREKIVGQLKKGFQKATENQGPLVGVWHQLQLFFDLCKDYYEGRYTDVDRKTLIVIVAGLLYFISPLDFIPDFVLGVGFLDDAFILGYVYKKVAGELKKYQDWKDGQAISI